MQKRRDGTIVNNNEGQDRLLKKLYGSRAGRALIKCLIRPWISRAAGAFLSTGLSKPLIPLFVRKSGIDLSQYEEAKWKSYNEFFRREIRRELRPVDGDGAHLVSPCDSKLTVYRVEPDCHFVIKHTPYTVESLLKNRDLAREFAGGWVLVFRLTVDDYHRYSYPNDGTRGDFVRIPGVLHTVNPVANDVYPIYKENAREYCVIDTEAFGRTVMMEVGALMVGKIVNHECGACVKRGQEKGYFEFGGSTVVMLLKKDAAEIDPDILENSAANIATVVKMGERIGEKK